MALVWCLWWQSVSRKDMETLLPQSAAYRKKWDFRSQADSHSPNLQSTSQEQSLFNPCANNSCLICLAADSSFSFSKQEEYNLFWIRLSLKISFLCERAHPSCWKKKCSGRSCLRISPPPQTEWSGSAAGRKGLFWEILFSFVTKIFWNYHWFLKREEGNSLRAGELVKWFLHTLSAQSDHC